MISLFLSWSMWIVLLLSSFGFIGLRQMADAGMSYWM